MCLVFLFWFFFHSFRKTSYFKPKKRKKMSLFAQLVCSGCAKILTYSLGAISCRCADCGTITPAQLIAIDCPGCEREIVAPINTVELLCPVCATTTLIPTELLPRVSTPREDSDEQNANEPGGVSMVVRNPAARSGGETTVSVATKIVNEQNNK
jgi:LSD1 subclass zinc finger protein